MKQNITQNKTFAHVKSEAKLARQAVIIEAAERVFAVKAFNEVSIRDIAREAGISHASIYRYFPDQQSLFIEAFLRGAGEITATLEKLIENAKTPDIMKVTDAYVTYLMDNDQYFRMMTHFMLDGALSAEKIEKLNAAERRIFDQFDRMFQKMKKPEPIRLLSHAFFAALNGVLITFRNYPGRTTEAVRQHMLNIARIIARSFGDT
ncbi:MAG TPA: TetR/AcrR family transcriptional regulator [Smithellaceae bacterium]|jgi:AcrR family transcriptional regulator|nr:TetR/AcrR family transcriptional regulator [Smithellaceae bacterium]HQG80410.1 TetR/AcrR family transcriptional regulator [Smithellaceae bacterium]